jgi:hypothetical protein
VSSESSNPLAPVPQGTVRQILRCPTEGGVNGLGYPMEDVRTKLLGG